MTLHQLTHSSLFELDFGFARLLERLASLLGGWAAARREEAELARLDHRELADLNSRL